MSEFKGTKELQVNINSNQVLNKNGVLVIANVNDYEGEGKYNTLLFSKAPQMLERLKHISEQMEVAWRRYDNEEDYDLEQIFYDIDLEELDNLIKEATELK